MTRTPREAFRAWRRSTGYSQAEAGALFGLSGSAVAWWETGRSPVPERVQARLRDEVWLPRPDPRGANRAPLNHQPPCPPGTACRSCRTRRRWEKGPLGVRRDTWIPEADARLRELAGSASLAVIAQQISAEFGVNRTAHAIMCRCHRLGISTVRHAYTATQVGYYCGVDEVTVGRWVAQGWLQSERTRRRTAHSITAEALEAFLRAYPGVVDWQAMPVLHGRARYWRELVEGIWRRAPFYDAETVGRWLQVHPHTVTRWCRAGRLQGWQVPSAHGKGGQARWRISQAAVLTFERARETVAS